MTSLAPSSASGSVFVVRRASRGPGHGRRLQVGDEAVHATLVLRLALSGSGTDVSGMGVGGADDGKYVLTAEEPDRRIDFCRSCGHYVNGIDGDKIQGRVHVGLELLAAARPEMSACDKDLAPLDVCG